MVCMAFLTSYTHQHLEAHAPQRSSNFSPFTVCTADQSMSWHPETQHSVHESIELGPAQAGVPESAPHHSPPAQQEAPALLLANNLWHNTPHATDMKPTQASHDSKGCLGETTQHWFLLLQQAVTAASLQRHHSREGTGAPAA